MSKYLDYVALTKEVDAEWGAPVLVYVAPSWSKLKPGTKVLVDDNEVATVVASVSHSVEGEDAKFIEAFCKGEAPKRIIGFFTEFEYKEDEDE